MTTQTVNVGVNSRGRPARCRLTTVTADVGTGVTGKARCAGRLVVVGGAEGDVNSAISVYRCSVVVTGVTGRAYGCFIVLVKAGDSQHRKVRVMGARCRPGLICCPGIMAASAISRTAIPVRGGAEVTADIGTCRVSIDRSQPGQSSGGVTVISRNVTGVWQSTDIPVDSPVHMGSITGARAMAIGTGPTEATYVGRVAGAVWWSTLCRAVTIAAIHSAVPGRCRTTDGSTVTVSGATA